MIDVFYLKFLSLTAEYPVEFELSDNIYSELNEPKTQNALFRNPNLYNMDFYTYSCGQKGLDKTQFME